MKYLYKGNIITASSKEEAIKIIADTDELNDADLGLNVNPREYHKQKSKMLSLVSKLDSIKNFLNKDSEEYNEELAKYAKKLNERNRVEWPYDNKGDRWLYYNGPLSKEILIEAFKDGFRRNIYRKPDSKEINKFKRNWLKNIGEKLLNNKVITVYRGLHFGTPSKLDLKYVKYNLMDRNSWSTSKTQAMDYAMNPGIVLKMKCSLTNANLALSAFLEGSWFYVNNKEVNLRKSLKVEKITVSEVFGKVYDKDSNKEVELKSLLRDALAQG